MSVPVHPRRTLAAIALLSWTLSACGRASEAKAETPPVAPAAAGSFAPAAATPATVAPPRGSGAPTKPAVEPGTPLARAVEFERLKELLPEIDGWTRSELMGEQLTTPVTYARAEAVYRKDDSRIELVITDSALSQMLLAPVAIFLAPGYSERSDDGFRRAVKIGGQPAMEQWNSGSRRAAVTALVGGRYLVHAEGDDVSGVGPVVAAVENVNLSRLAALK